MTNNHFQDYRTLGLEPGCTWKELQTAYRRLVQATHPDRFTSESRGKDLAEESLKTINRAFRNLADYRQRHGALPNSDEPGIVNPASTTSTAGRNSPDDISHKGFPAASWVPSSAEQQAQSSPGGSRNRGVYVRTALLWVGIAIIVTLAFGEELWTTSSEDSPAPITTQVSANLTGAPNTLGMPADSKVTVPVQDKFFTIGSSMGEVYDIQGVPTSTKDGLWYYGSSKVYFSKGVVTSWEQTPSYLLKAELSLNQANSTTKSFAVGSSKADVRTAMGAPLFEYDEIWDYGASKVFFRNGKVTGWENSSLRPLKLRR